MIAPATANPTPANPAPLQDGQIAPPDSAALAPAVNPETPRTSPATSAPQPDGQVAPPATDPVEPGTPGTPENPSAGAPETPGTAPATPPSDTSNAGIRKRIDSITAEINELRGRETLSESEQLRLQELTQSRTELFTMLSNLMKQEHEARMAIIRNL
ncbi:MAG: hypothetical protein AAF333_02375 [Planctomycetota bacterium]